MQHFRNHLYPNNEQKFSSSTPTVEIILDKNYTHLKQYM